jgi:hypothetical protein
MIAKKEQKAFKKGKDTIVLYLCDITRKEILP